jgi:predicted nucleotidyltransferase
MENYQALYNYVLSIPSIQEAIQKDRILLISLSGSRAIDVENNESDYDVAIVFKDVKSKGLTATPWGEFEGKKLNFLKSSYDALHNHSTLINWDIINFLIPKFSPYEPIYKHPDYNNNDFEALHDEAIEKTFDVISKRYLESSPIAVNRFVNEKRIYWLLALHFSRMKEMGEKELDVLREYRKLSTDRHENHEVLTEEFVLEVLSDIKNKKTYYDSLTVAELKSLASERGLSGYSSMVKADLIELHREYDQESRTQQEVSA